MKRALLLFTFAAAVSINITSMHAMPTKAQTGAILIGGAIATAVACEVYAIVKAKVVKLRKFCSEKPHWPIAAAASAIGLCLICQGGLETMRNLQS